MPRSSPSVLVVGGGAASVFVTVALRERAAALGLPAPEVTVVARDIPVGLGLAYGRAEAHHRLNSPASAMSLSSAEQGGFLAHLDEMGWRDVDGSEASAGSFIPRQVYGGYVAGAFQALLDDPASGVTAVQGEAVSVVDVGGRSAVTLADATELQADVVVLALGNPPPGRVRVPTAGVGRTVDDPWARGALDGIRATDRVLLIGTGLTTIDIATSLARRHPGVVMTATSRHLLLPAVHLVAPVPAWPGFVSSGEAPRLPGLLREFGRQLRTASAAGEPWQPVLDGVRPQIHALWQALDAADRKRFVAHVARRWDVHRHRMAQSVWAELSALIDSGTLTLSADVSGEEFDVAVNCTGPNSVAAPGWSPLVDGLLSAGAVVPDPAGLGFDADASGALVGAAGGVSTRLFAIGAALKGALWETVAVPEVRLVATRIAERVLPA
ncbi:FAD/NAD(P)-binding protein [Frondihabitans sp. VKM Ac-2883]|uniref:FAD/NAD(P)-binding protein n=1 Tax=Frondihabitans sp. VKM Ac-2883 TaxID=2783823 RepID=UPI00188D171D|nr:FAD/NAD(P)-binding protein [Frondihabitans sp. VKM Ac-2883]